jgi:ABC-type antimicrobial peptide transport system permease subunit
VVGVVSHLRHRRATAEMNEQIYFPLAQAPRHPVAYVVRSAGDPAALSPAVRDLVGRMSPQLPVFDVRPLADYVSDARATQRFTVLLAGAFALLALMLTGVGVYGVVAYAVLLRRQEFGVRRALGAQSRQIVSAVLREVGRLALTGVVLGLAGAGIAAYLLRSQLLGVQPYDPASYLLSAGALALASLLAGGLPLRRALSVSPVEALRSE